MAWALVAAGASLLGGAMASDAAGKASDAQQQASAASIAEQARQFDLTRSDNAQFLKTGTAANKRLSALMGLDDGNGQDGPLLRKFTTDDLNADPVYRSGLQFGADQGRDAINARAMQAGNYDSGATLKALTRFGNDYGSQKAGDSYNRFVNDQSNTYSRLTGTSGGGQVASGANAAAGTAAANSISGSIDAAGNARAAGIVGGSNAWGQGLTGAAGAYNNYQNNQQLMALLRERNRSAGIPSGGGGDV